MGAVIVYARNDVFSGAPQATQIEAALRSIPRLGNQLFKPTQQGFVGIRIVRTARLASLTGRLTEVGALYMWVDPPTATPEQKVRLGNDISVALRGAAQSALAGVTGGDPTNWSTQTVPYDPAINGSVEWWQSPTGASATSTRNGFDLNQQVGSSASVDNPIGPTVTRPPSLQVPTPPSVNSITYLLVAASVLLALVYFGPQIASMFRSRPRRNPDRYRHYRRSRRRLSQSA